MYDALVGSKGYLMMIVDMYVVHVMITPGFEDSMN